MDISTLILALSMLVSSAAAGEITPQQLVHELYNLREQVESLAPEAPAAGSKALEPKEEKPVVITNESPRTHVKPTIPPELLEDVQRMSKIEERVEAIFKFLKSEAEQGRSQLPVWSDAVLRDQAVRELKQRDLLFEE